MKELEQVPTMVLKQIIAIAKREIQERDDIFVHNRNVFTKKSMIIISELVKDKNFLKQSQRKIAAFCNISLGAVSNTIQRLELHGFTKGRKVINSKELERLYELRLKHKSIEDNVNIAAHS